MATKKKAVKKSGTRTRGTVPTVSIGNKAKSNGTRTRTSAKAGKKSARKLPKRARPKSRVDVTTPPMDQTPPDMPDHRPIRHSSGTVPASSSATPGAVQSGVEPSSPEGTQLPPQATPPPPPPPPVHAPPPAVNTATPPMTVPTGVIVQGANCTWLSDVAFSDGPDNAPVCPGCGGGLQETPDRLTMEQGFVLMEMGTYPTTNVHAPARPHPGYVRFMSWLQKQNKRCWPTLEEAAAQYESETGQHVDPLP